MYILKNALRSIARAKGRSILIGIIVFVISLSSCLALSIREAADTAEETALSGLEITAQITMDRQAVMENFDTPQDRGAAMTDMQELSLEDLETYAQAESVKSFYYSASASMNGSSLEPVDTSGLSSSSSESTEDEGLSADASQGAGGQDGEMGAGRNMDGDAGAMPGGGRMGIQGDFTVTGYSSDEAMTDFISGSSSVTEGSMFTEGSDDYTCVISEELAAYNDLSVGDTITLSNPNQEEETYELTISGIYETTGSGSSAQNMMGGFSTAADSANQIYVSYGTLDSIAQASLESASETTDEETGMTSTTALQTMLSGTYTFADADDYYAFEEQARELGLSDDYTVSSGDLTSYEESLEPLQNLSKYAGYFLLVILLIGAVILVVLNIFNIRERKYEIGVLAAIGMKKWKISMQFLAELLCITFCALLIGSGIGAVSSVPLTNTLLAQQIESSSQTAQAQTERFGREMGGGAPADRPNQGGDASDQDGGSDRDGSSDPTDGDAPADVPDQGGGFFGTGMTEYIDSVSSAANLTVLGQLILIGLLLTAISALTAMIFILRYDPLRILSSRD